MRNSLFITQDEAKILFGSLVIGTALFFGISSCLPEPAHTQVSKPAPVLIETLDDEGTYGWGSSIPTQHGLLASNHVVQDHDLTINGSNQYLGILAEGDSFTERDFTLIDWHTNEYATISCEPWSNETVYYRGYSRLGDLYVPLETRGYISNTDVRVKNKTGDYPAAAVDIGVSPGMSGGGFFNERGELIGMLTAMVPTQSYTYAIMTSIPEELCP